MYSLSTLFCFCQKFSVTASLYYWFSWFSNFPFQVYQVTTEEYICHSKYHGRRLDCDGVRRTLRCFLHNGRRPLSELLLPILERLRRLHSIIEHLVSYRFYSSSLLIMYDGAITESERCAMDEDSDDKRPSVAVCMIDFAHSTHSNFPGDQVVHQGPDRGYLFGLANLISLFEEMSAESFHCSGNWTFGYRHYINAVSLLVRSIWGFLWWNGTSLSRVKRVSRAFSLWSLMALLWQPDLSFMTTVMGHNSCEFFTFLFCGLSFAYFWHFLIQCVKIFCYKCHFTN